jgi:drug/metabolite transporter (DMT)-like permease
MLVAPFVLGEAITPSLLAGGALVIFGVWLVEKRNKKS